MAPRALDPREASWLAIARRIARPAGPRVAAVRAALSDYAVDALDPREAWEALVARGIAAEPWATRGPADVQRAGGNAKTTAAESIVAIAGDPTGVATVEALSAELARRLEPWNEAFPTRVLWRTVAVTEKKFPVPQPFASSPAFAAMEALFDTLAWTSKEDGALRRSVERAFRPVSGRPSGTVTEAKPLTRPGDPPWCARFWDRAGAGQHALYHATNAALWSACVERDLPVGRNARTRARRFRELLDPAEVLLEIWRLGYVVGAVSDASITVYAPERWSDDAR